MQDDDADSYSKEESDEFEESADVLDLDPEEELEEEYETEGILLSQKTYVCFQR